MVSFNCASDSGLQNVVFSHRYSSHKHSHHKELRNSGKWNKRCKHFSKQGRKLHMPGHQQVWNRRETARGNQW